MRFTSALFTPSNRALATLAAVSFLMAAASRFALIGVTPRSNSFIDVQIYAAGGQLMSHGINPYDPADGSDFRQKLREKYDEVNAWFAETQPRFDYYAGGNLPLNLMLFGAIDHFFPANPIAYRAVFALADSLLSAFVVYFVFKVWRLAPSLVHLILAAGLGVFSPILFAWGFFSPEDKGLQILLMISAVYFAWSGRWVLSALLLGGSIAFKGLGVFIAPLCAWYAAARPRGLHEWVSRPVLARCACYAAIVAVVAAVWFLPYLHNIFAMMTHRLSPELGTALPKQGSMWLPACWILPGHWAAVKNAFMLFFVLRNLIGFARGRLAPEVITASLLVLFVDVALLAGNLDRYNIGLLVAILIIGASDQPFALWLGEAYFAASLMLTGLYLLWCWPRLLAALTGLRPWELHRGAFDSCFALVLVICMTILLAVRSFGGSPPTGKPQKCHCRPNS